MSSLSPTSAEENVQDGLTTVGVLDPNTKVPCPLNCIFVTSYIDLYSITIFMILKSQNYSMFECGMSLSYLTEQ